MSTGLARNAAINLIGGVFAPLASVVSGPLLARALSVEGRGELAAATVPLFLALSLATIGLPEAVTYFVAKNRSETKAILRRGSRLIVLPAAVATVLLLATSSWLSDGNPMIQRLIIASACLVLPALLLSIVRAVAAAHNRWTLIAIERIITAFARLIPLVVLFVIGRLGLVSAVVVTLASSFVGALVYLRLLKFQQGKETDTTTSATLLKYGSGVWIGAISGILVMRIDQVLMTPLAGVYELGLYTVAVSISELPLIVNAAIRETAFTYLSDPSGKTRDIGELSRLSTIMVFLCAVPIAVLSPFLVPLLFGAEFSGSVPVLAILLVTVCLANPGSLAGVGLSSSGLPHLRSFALVVACIANVVLVLVLVPPFGAIGAALASLGSYFLGSNIAIAWMIVKRGATLGDFYRFRSSDFVMIWRLIRRGLAVLRRPWKLPASDAGN